MAEKKTVKEPGDVTQFVESIDDERQREESKVLLELMGRITGAPPAMWGKTIVGFGNSSITYANGHEEPWFSVGFSPRKGKFSLYVMDDASEHEAVLSRLGTYKTGKACLWVRRLDDVDMAVLEEIITAAVERDRAKGYM
ncbi:MAG: DUF1801 domain-containing protein [Spirochaetota bacterium]